MGSSVEDLTISLASPCANAKKVCTMKTSQDSLGKSTNQTINSQGHNTEYSKVGEIILISSIPRLSLSEPVSEQLQHLAEVCL